MERAFVRSLRRCVSLSYAHLDPHPHPARADPARLPRRAAASDHQRRRGRADQHPALAAGLLRSLCRPLGRSPRAAPARTVERATGRGHHRAGARRVAPGGGRRPVPGRGRTAAQRHQEPGPGRTGLRRGDADAARRVGPLPPASDPCHLGPLGVGLCERARRHGARLAPDPADAPCPQPGRVGGGVGHDPVLLDRHPDHARHRALGGLRVHPVLRQGEPRGVLPRHPVEPADRAARRSGCRGRGLRGRAALHRDPAHFRHRHGGGGADRAHVRHLSVRVRPAAGARDGQAAPGGAGRHPDRGLRLLCCPHPGAGDPRHRRVAWARGRLRERAGGGAGAGHHDHPLCLVALRRRDQRRPPGDARRLLCPGGDPIRDHPPGGDPGGPAGDRRRHPACRLPRHRGDHDRGDGRGAGGQSHRQSAGERDHGDGANRDPADRRSGIRQRQDARRLRARSHPVPGHPGAQHHRPAYRAQVSGAV